MPLRTFITTTVSPLTCALGFFIYLLKRNQYEALAVWTRMILSHRYPSSSLLCLPKIRIKDVSHHTWLRRKDLSAFVIFPFFWYFKYYIIDNTNLNFMEQQYGNIYFRVIKTYRFLRLWPNFFLKFLAVNTLAFFGGAELTWMFSLHVKMEPRALLICGHLL